jgi:hypothetical protein
MERRMRQMQTEFDQKIYDLEKKLTEEHAEIVKMREE